jgi:hypothetical protein
MAKKGKGGKKNKGGVPMPDKGPKSKQPKKK